MIGLCAVFAVTVLVAFKEVKVVDVQEEERSGFRIEARLPETTTLEEAESFFLECEKIVENSQEELGLSGWFIFHRPTYGRVEGFFNNPRTTDLSPREVTEKVLERLPKKPGVRFFTGREGQQEEKGDQVRFLAAPSRIWREEKRTTRTITLELEEGKEDEARAHIFTLQNQLRLPEGVRFGEVKDTSSADEDLAALRFAASLSVVFIYLLMGFLFESFVLPLSIICTIPSPRSEWGGSTTRWATTWTSWGWWGSSSSSGSW